MLVTHLVEQSAKPLELFGRLTITAPHKHEALSRATAHAPALRRNVFLEVSQCPIDLFLATKQILEFVHREGRQSVNAEHLIYASSECTHLTHNRRLTYSCVHRLPCTSCQAAVPSSGFRVPAKDCRSWELNHAAAPIYCRPLLAIAVCLQLLQHFAGSQGFATHPSEDRPHPGYTCSDLRTVPTTSAMHQG